MEINIDYKERDTFDPSLYIDISHVEDGFIETPIGKVKRIKTNLTKRDIFHDYYARWKIKRNNFRVPVGLYGIGNPNEESPVLVTANYKLTLDKLRKELNYLDLWLIVIDTQGINVWCAAGKGTFGTEEIIYRIKNLKLNKIVSHKNIILPQLGAPGVVAHEVMKNTGFKVIYGPVRAKDIPEFILNDFKTTPEMRRVSFGLIDRIVLTPIEILLSFRYIPIILIFFIVLNLISLDASSTSYIIKQSVFNSIPYLGAFFIGSFLLPVLLPLLPFRALSLKGFTLGIVWSILIIKFNYIFLFDNSYLVIFGNTLLLTSITTILGLNFTGATTYTSFSGVQRETLWTIPIVAIASLIGVVLLIAEQLI